MNLFNNLLLAEIGKQAAFARWVRKLVGHLNSLVLTVEPPLYLRDDGPHGKHLSIRLSSTPPPEMPVIKHPFQIYQYTPDPENPQVSDWRTVRVNEGYLNANKGWSSLNFDTSYVLNASTTYHFWLEVTLNTSGDYIGWPSDVKVDRGTEGWTNYPDQPLGNSETGAPPSKYYIEVATVTTSNDTNKVLTITPVEYGNKRVEMGVVGWSVNTANLWCLVRRMVHWSTDAC